MVDAKRVALVIGNSAYVNTSSLSNPVNDANIVADSARKSGFDDVVVALDLTISSFQRASYIPGKSQWRGCGDDLLCRSWH